MFAGLIKNIGALVNELVPTGFALKGLEKLDPRFKKFFQSAFLAGYPADKAMSFLRGKYNEHQDRSTMRPDEAAAAKRVEQSQEFPDALQKAAALGIGGLSGLSSIAEDEEKPFSLGTGPFAGKAPTPPQGPQEAQQTQAQGAQAGASPKGTTFQEKVKTDVKSILGDYFKKHPELSSFLDKIIGSGKSPREAGELAKGHKVHGSIVNGIEQELNKPFPDLLEYLFGPSNPQPARKVSPSMEHLINTIAEVKRRRGGK